MTAWFPVELSSLDAKDVFGPIVGGLAGYFSAKVLSHSGEGIAETSREDAREVTREATRVANAEDLTARIQTLMNGYEERIKDLTNEVKDLRIRVEVCEKRWRERDAATI